MPKLLAQSGLTRTLQLLSTSNCQSGVKKRSQTDPFAISSPRKMTTSMSFSQTRKVLNPPMIMIAISQKDFRTRQARSNTLSNPKTVRKKQYAVKHLFQTHIERNSGGKSIQVIFYPPPIEDWILHVVLKFIFASNLGAEKKVLYTSLVHQA